MYFWEGDAGKEAYPCLNGEMTSYWVWMSECGDERESSIVCACGLGLHETIQENYYDYFVHAYKTRDSL